MAEDYYEVLGVSRSASPEEIKKAFRAKAHQHHPDKSSGDADAFKRINEAYQVLSNPEKRQQYDQFGQTFDQARRTGQTGPGFGDAWQNINVDFGDLGDMFGDLFGFGGSRGRRTPTRGRDIQAVVSIPFRISIFGGQEEIALRHATACDHCAGSGAEPGTDSKSCPTCGGSGQVRNVQRTVLGAIESVQSCPTCEGSGTVPTRKCSHCHGEGRVTKNEKYTIKIPAGISAGQKIRLAGKGEAGPRGAPSGDLYIQVEVEPDPQFSREGDDILSTHSIPMTIAALGGTTDVETVDGRVTLKIPAGTPGGKVFLLKNHGATRLRGRGRGDQRVTIEVEIPSRLSAEAKRLLKLLREEGL